MAKPASARDGDSVGNYLRTIRGEALPYRQVLDLLTSIVPFTEAVIVTSLPRGGLQIVQPPRLPEPLIRVYARDVESHDRLSWQAIAQQRPIRARDAWRNGELESSLFYRDFMRPNDFAYAVAVPLKGPVLDGYGGALHLYRDSARVDFSEDELSRLASLAGELDAATARMHAARRMHPTPQEAIAHRAAVRQFIFDANLNLLLPHADPALLEDSRLQENIRDDARRRFEHLTNGQSVADRVPLADSRGDLWNFRVVMRREYPALSDGPVIFFCLQPTCSDWSALRAVDFQADNEVARLVPALKFMRDHFHRGPTLVEIAKAVHLSPFHFHRRFTELLGITPKHFLLDCQIQQAKQDLLAREKDLVKIATECGFAHQSHFTSRFKQATGLTPTRWRKMAAEANKASRN